MSDEHELNIARREAEQIASSEAYFAARHWSNDSIQSRKVFEAGFERAWESQRARHAALEAELERYEGALQELLDATDEPPEAKCSCHMSPPCSDCVDFGHIREAIATARAALKPAKEG